MNENYLGKSKPLQRSAMQPRSASTWFLLAILSPALLATSLLGQQSSRKVLVRVPAKYPALLQSKKIGGLVKVRVVISPSGNVRTTELMGGNPILAEAAIDAIKKWRYERAPADTAAVVELRFDPY